jgi:hypothetical protein
METSFASFSCVVKEELSHRIADASLLLQEKERDHFSHFVTESFTAYCKRKRRDKVKTFATNGGLEIGGFSH